MPTDSQWLDVCKTNAQIMSTCQRRSYFSIILDSSGMVIGTGWNGVPSGMRHCDQGGCPRAESGSVHGSGYSNCFAIHAEANALLHSDWTGRSKGNGSTLYVNGPPCFDCAKLIANSGIARLVCIDDNNYPEWPRIKTFLKSCGVRVITEGLLYEQSI